MSAVLNPFHWPLEPAHVFFLIHLIFPCQLNCKPLDPLVVDFNKKIWTGRGVRAAL